MGVNTISTLEIISATRSIDDKILGIGTKLQSFEETINTLSAAWSSDNANEIKNCLNNCKDYLAKIKNNLDNVNHRIINYTENTKKADGSSNGTNSRGGNGHNISMIN